MRSGADARVVANALILGEKPTGLGIYASAVARALAEAGERVVVYTSRPELIGRCTIELRRVPAWVRPEHGAAGHIVRLLWIQTVLVARLHAERPRVLLNLAPEGPLFARVPQITTVPDLLPLRFPDEYPRLRYYFRYILPWLLRRSASVAVVSEATRRDVRRFFSNVDDGKIFVAPGGCDHRRFSPDGPKARAGPEPYVLYVGNVLPHKNLERLVAAFAAATRRIPARLVIRGSGPAGYVARILEAIGRERISDRVDWEPYVAPEALPALYRGARVLLLPSLHEGFGLTLLEAMGCGTPVVTSNVASMPEVVGEAGLLVNPLDVWELAEAIERVLRDDGLAEDLRERGLERARLFSWDRTAALFQRAIRGAMAG